jgi:hypothetical protein
MFAPVIIGRMARVEYYHDVAAPQARELLRWSAKSPRKPASPLT